MMTDATDATPPIRKPKPYQRLRVARDFVIGLGVYTVIVFATACGPGQIHDGHGAMFSSGAHAAAPLLYRPENLVEVGTAAVYRSTDERQAITILGLAFATLVALNLAFFRHLRRVYASPR